MQILSLIIAGTFFLSSGCADKKNTNDKTVVTSEQSIQAQAKTEDALVQTNAVEATPVQITTSQEAPAQEVPNVVAPLQTAPDHAIFNTLLQKYVSASGTVNYAGLKKDEATLDKYLALLAKATPAKDWKKDVSLAYWINAYNAFTIKLILKNYPVKKITDLANGKPWDEKWIKLGAQTYTLNNIENDIIRPTYEEPRIHFALNCAAVSCPPLANKAFTKENLEAMLTARTTAFLNSSANDLIGNPIKVSKIFDWYKEDFGVLPIFINKYSTKKVAAKVAVDYKDYDWKLNGK